MTATRARTWIRSSYSTAEGAECVEIAPSADNVYIRDSKDPHGERLALPARQWSAFVAFAAGRS
ncbi:DUF397 domain-containing protein [Streptomyces sp. B6B3]|uniref:DUF397 domain-containing protein n=1 Tax=Streptomyces sp. B6B3 TaxID=3153570 RepID=UPI00325CF8A7